MQVSTAFVQSKIPDRMHLHSSLLRNQLFVPKLKDNMMTVAFMKGVVGYETYWVPMCADIRLRNCADPPKKEDIAIELVNTMRSQGSGDQEIERQFQATATEIRKTPPNATWMLAMLSTMNPNHPFFAKDYEKPKVRASGVADSSMINNPGNFFTGLPTASKQKKRSRGINFSDKAKLEQQRLQQLQARLASLDLQRQR